MRYGYPILLDVTERLIVIVGGGAVAARKAGGLLAAGARRVRVVAPIFADQMPANIERLAEAYRPEHLADAELVFAATDRSEVNDAVVRDAQARRIFVNRADADEEFPGDFTIPALHRADRLMVTVSADGNPALAAKVRDELAKRLEPGWIRMAQAMAELRPLIRDSGLPIQRRRELFRWLASDEARDLLMKNGMEELKERMKAEKPET